MKSLSQQKEQARKKFSSLEGRQQLSVESFLQLLSFSSACSLGSFQPLKDEVLIQDYPADCTLAWPKIENESTSKMSFYSSQSFKSSSLGFKEPDEQANLVNSDEMAVIFVPGLAFDYKGQRLGRGKGYYDRYLQNFKGLKVGVCAHSRFSQDLLPTDPCLDVSMDWVLTEKITYKINPYKKVV